LFLLITIVITLFVFSYNYVYLFPLARFALVVVCSLLTADGIVLYLSGNTILANRFVHNQLSLGDEQPVKIKVFSKMRIPVFLEVIDEAPYQLQLRNLKLKTQLNPGETKSLSYLIKPLDRGIYEFGNIHIFISTPLNLIQRRITISAKKTVSVYPSVIQMRKYELQVFSKLSLSQGIKRVRRLGHSNEFEQIKNYVQGDDYRSINWKATSRKNELMVNQYEDEKSQQVYCIIDKSRSMQMPFSGMTLLDYAINSALVISNIALRKYDRAGLITFSNKIGSRLKSESNSTQIKRILEILYKQKTHFLESNYELLYHAVLKTIKGRSLLLLFTNFESHYALQRALPVLRKLNKQHLLVVIFFENSELVNITQIPANSLKDIYTKTIAQNLIFEKKLMVYELKNLGIQCVLTSPEKLSVDTINKYLELKSRGMI
jgi:uncharacterized protein (DUF58 family)